MRRYGVLHDRDRAMSCKRPGRLAGLRSHGAGVRPDAWCVRPHASLHYFLTIRNTWNSGPVALGALALPPIGAETPLLAIGSDSELPL